MDSTSITDIRAKELKFQEELKKTGDFQQGLSELINKLSLENQCNLPDFVIAEYLVTCFEALCKTIQEKDKLLQQDVRNTA